MRIARSDLGFLHFKIGKPPPREDRRVCFLRRAAQKSGGVLYFHLKSLRLESEFLAANGRLEHKPTYSMNEHDHSLMIACFSL